MDYHCIRLTRDADVTTITMDRPERRNALSLLHMQELTDAFARVGASDARGVVLAANGPVFCAGHDFADVAGSDLEQ
ncbi:MAG TPA: enoyl-CoA hydratase/isomerase family protein, partial [Dermatophilaceae bacterium]